MSKSNNAVEVRGVKKSFYLPNHKNDSIKRAITQAFKKKDKGGDTFNALNGISFNIEKGDFFGILGRNGSGKSTLLKIIAEIYQPTAGTVKTKGRVVSFIELGVGFKSELSGRENVYLNGALLGFSRKEIDVMYDDIVEFAELEKFMGQKLKNYSSGMKVRLAFSVAIRAKADILILDEVLAVGDAAFQRKCTNYFRTLKEGNKTVILVTHSMANVRKFCNKAIVIDDGEIVFEGGAEEAAESYNGLFTGKVTPRVVNDRYTKEIVISNFNTVIEGGEIVAKATLTCGDNPKTNVKFGVKLRDNSGYGVAGANTVNSDDPLVLNFKAGESKHLTVHMPNILGDGVYSISATVNYLDNDTVADSIQDGVVVSNSRKDSYYPIVMPTIFSVESDID